MRASPQLIWQVPAYLPYLQPPLTPEIITNAEQQIGFRLPEHYLALLRVQNGGYIRYGLSDRCHDQIYGIGPYFPSLTNFDWDSSRDLVSYELDGLVPFDGDGHWHLCLDYRKCSSAPSVTYVDIECDRESPIATTFEEYFSILQLDVGENVYVMPSLSNLPLALEGIAGKLGVSFYPPDSFAHGYPEYRAGGRTENKPEWIWISPNTVRRGFVRNSDDRFEELRHLMPEKVPRFPQLPESSYLLTATVGFLAPLLVACGQLSIEVRPLIEYTNTKNS